jgi:formylglycine-generating enzyme required for sulfatase activity
MSTVAKHADFRDSRNSFSAATFRKVLKGFEIGGLPYTEVEFQLKRLLATGVPASELREVLRRCELIEPLPEYAYRQVAGLLDEAIEREAALQLDAEGALEQPEESDPATLSSELQLARDALEAEHLRVQEAEEALSERIASEESAQSRLDTALRESEHYQAELRVARNTIASRDKVTVQMRQTLDRRDAELAAMRAELDTQRNRSQEIERSLTDVSSLSGAAREALASRDKMLAEMRESLAERDAKLAALQREHAESLTSNNSHIGSARESLASQSKILAEVRQTLAERDAKLGALQREHDESLLLLESERRKSREVEHSFTNSKSQISSARDSLAARDKALAEARQALAESESRTQKAEDKLHAAQKRVTAASAELENLRAQVSGLQAKLRDSNVLIEKLGASVKNEVKRAAQWQAVAQQRESKAAPILPRGEGAPVQVYPPLEVLPYVDVPPRVLMPGASASLLPRFRLNLRAWRWNFPAVPPVAWIGVAIVLLAIVIGILVHRGSPAPSKPVVAKAPGIQPGTTIRDCPTCPVLTVLPTGRFEQGSAPTENGSTFEKPLHWVMISHPIALSTNAVTVDQFREFVAATGRDMQGCDVYDGEWRYRAESNWENPGFEQTGSHPVTCTSWNDAKAYAAWLSAKTGQHYRLPSASEWEYAARAAGLAAQPWSAEDSDACANANVADQSAAHRYPGWTVFACDDGYIQTAPVGSFKANSFGLNDMLGNVFQWTEDCWNADYKGAPVNGSARLDGNCAEHELRGGSWFSTPNYVRANYRNHFAADYRTSTVGIRLVRDMAS